MKTNADLVALPCFYSAEGKAHKQQVHVAIHVSFYIPKAPPLPWPLSRLLHSPHSLVWCSSTFGAMPFSLPSPRSRPHSFTYKALSTAKSCIFLHIYIYYIRPACSEPLNQASVPLHFAPKGHTSKDRINSVSVLAGSLSPPAPTPPQPHITTPHHSKKPWPSPRNVRRISLVSSLMCERTAAACQQGRANRPKISSPSRSHFSPTGNIKCIQTSE